MIRDRRWQTKMANPSALWYYKTWRPTLCLDRGDPAQSDTSPAHTHTYTHTHLLITVFCSSSLAWWKRLWQRKTFPSNWPPKMWLSSRFDWTHNSPAHLRPLTVELPSYSSLILTSCLELVQLFAIFFFFWTNFGQTFFFFFVCKVYQTNPDMLPSVNPTPSPSPSTHPSLLSAPWFRDALVWDTDKTVHWVRGCGERGFCISCQI